MAIIVKTSMSRVHKCRPAAHIMEYDFNWAGKSVGSTRHRITAGVLCQFQL